MKLRTFLKALLGIFLAVFLALKIESVVDRKHTEKLLAQAKADAQILFEENAEMFRQAALLGEEIEKRAGSFMLRKPGDASAVEYSFYGAPDNSIVLEDPDLYLSADEQDFFESLFAVSYNDVRVMECFGFENGFVVFEVKSYYWYILNVASDAFQDHYEDIVPLDDDWCLVLMKFVPG